MSGVRRAWLDACPGERRGVVTLNGRPEHLLMEREGEGEAPSPRLGERWRGRLGARAPDGWEAFVELGPRLSAVLKLGAAPTPAEGAVLEVEITAEPQGGKSARVLLIGPSAADGALGRLTPALTLEEQLHRLAPGAPIVLGLDARETADLAQEAALATAHAFKGGLTLTVQSTRAMTVIDVDLRASGERAGRVQDANLRAIRQTARLLRLKALGGTAAIDLIGFPKATGLMLAEARRAFEADGPEVAILPPNRFGVIMLSRPRRRRPVHELLTGVDGRPTPRTHAQQLVRDLEREGLADPGALLEAVCAPQIAAELAPLAAKLGPRFGVAATPGLAPAQAHIRRR